MARAADPDISLLPPCVIDEEPKRALAAIPCALYPAMTSSQSASSSGLHQQRQPQVFEFTKRKRWADILISELPETIILVLSMTCKVLYCGTGVGELLGWSVEDLVDADITSFINGASPSAWLDVCKGTY